MKHIIPILIILLLISSGFVGVSNTAEEQWVDTETTERDEFLDNLAFYCLDASGSNEKYESYKEQILKDYSKEDIEIIGEKVSQPKASQPIELPQTSVSSGPMDSPWPMQCHDLHHTSRSSYSTANITGLEKWRFKASDGVDGSPIIGDDGTIYFGDKDRYIYAIYPNGTLKWKYQTSGWITSAPALAENGTLYVTSWDKKLWAFESTTGVKKWTFDAGSPTTSSPAIGIDGIIYFGTMGEKFYAIYPNGTKKWEYSIGGDIYSHPAIGDDGTIYITSWESHHLNALNQNGTLKSIAPTKGCTPVTTYLYVPTPILQPLKILFPCTPMNHTQFEYTEIYPY